MNFTSYKSLGLGMINAQPLLLNSDQRLTWRATTIDDIPQSNFYILDPVGPTFTQVLNVTNLDYQVDFAYLNITAEQGFYFSKDAQELTFFEYNSTSKMITNKSANMYLSPNLVWDFERM